MHEPIIYRITGIFEMDGVTPKTEGQHRVGRRVHNYLPMQEGFFMRLASIENATQMFETTRITQIEQMSDNVLHVKTKNTLYVMEIERR